MILTNSALCVVDQLLILKLNIKERDVYNQKSAVQVET